MFKHIEIVDKLGFTLRGYLDYPEGAKRIVIFFHGCTGNLTEHNNHFKLLSRLLSANNIASLRMCYAGNGESDGYFYDSNFDNNVIDCKAMIDYVYDELGFKDVCLLGFSMGGLLASSLCNYRPINKIVLWSAADAVQEHWKRTYDNYRTLPNGHHYYAGFEIDEKFYQTVINLHPYEEAKKYNGPVLIIQGTLDKSVDPSTAINYNNAYKNSKLIMLEDCTHGYESYELQQKIFNESLEFFMQ